MQIIGSTEPCYEEVEIHLSMALALIRIAQDKYMLYNEATVWNEEIRQALANNEDARHFCEGYMYLSFVLDVLEQYVDTAIPMVKLLYDSKRRR